MKVTVGARACQSPTRTKGSGALDDRPEDPQLGFRPDSEHLRPGQIISLESTTYPGTTRGDCQPILDKTGLECGKDYFLAFSPEREDPGRPGVETKSIPKLVGGIDDTSGQLAYEMYSSS